MIIRNLSNGKMSLNRRGKSFTDDSPRSTAHLIDNQMAFFCDF